MLRPVVVIPAKAGIQKDLDPRVRGDDGKTRRASIAVMPFTDTSNGPRGRTADALAHDITTRLAKLRAMFVIAQGSTFALAERRIGPEEAGRMLNVDYVVSGAVRVSTSSTVTVSRRPCWRTEPLTT